VIGGAVSRLCTPNPQGEQNSGHSHQESSLLTASQRAPSSPQAVYVLPTQFLTGRDMPPALLRIHFNELALIDSHVPDQ
jgi:hypothetical protein